MSGQVAGRLVVLVPAALLAFFFAAGLIVLIRPCLLRHAMARPNPRSSHDTPVPQGGGIAVVLATLAVTWAAVLLWPNLSHGQIQHFWIVVAAAILLTILGTIDDMHSLPATVRLIAQGIAVGDVMIALPDELRLLPQLPWWMDRACLLIAGVWFVNLVNFMDGIDWMTVAEVVPVTGAMILLGILGAVDFTAAMIAARCSALPRSTNQSLAFFSATREAFRSDCCWAGCSCSLPSQATERQRSFFRSTILPMPRSRSCAAS